MTSADPELQHVGKKRSFLSSEEELGSDDDDAEESSRVKKRSRFHAVVTTDDTPAAQCDALLTLCSPTLCAAVQGALNGDTGNMVQPLVSSPPCFRFSQHFFLQLQQSLCVLYSARKASITSATCDSDVDQANADAVRFMRILLCTHALKGATTPKFRGPTFPELSVCM